MLLLMLHALVAVTEANGPVNWNEAQSLCRIRYESQLIPLRYIENHNLTRDITEELKPGASAWIDGKIQNIGCYRERCLKIKRSQQQNDKKLPYICVTSKGIVDIFPAKVLYKDSEKMCNADKFSSEFIHLALDAYKLGQIIEKFHPQLQNTTFWIPNVKITENSDTLCTFVTTRENSLDTFTGSCSIHQLGICINNSYIPDYQFTLMLDMTSSNTTTYVHVHSANSAFKSTPISNSSFGVTGHHLSLVLVVLVLMVLLFVAILQLKEMMITRKSLKEGTEGASLKLTITMEENDPG